MQAPEPSPSAATAAPAAAAAAAAAPPQEPASSAPPPSSAAEGAGPSAEAGEEPEPEERQEGKCPICVMFEEGGCKQAFDAFMDCGVDAEKGSKDYQECVVLFDAMRECMQRNPAVFAALLQDVNTSVGGAGSSKEEAAPEGGAAAVSTSVEGPGSSKEAAAP